MNENLHPITGRPIAPLAYPLVVDRKVVVDQRGRWVFIRHDLATSEEEAGQLVVDMNEAERRRARTPRTGDDAGLQAAVAAALYGCRPDQVNGLHCQIAGKAIAAVRSWDEANAGGVPVAGISRESIQTALNAMEALVRAMENGPGVFVAVDLDELHRLVKAGAEFESLTLPPAPGEAAAPVQGTVTCEDVFDVLLHNGYEISAHTVKDIENLFKTATKPEGNP